MSRDFLGKKWWTVIFYKNPSQVDCYITSRFISSMISGCPFPTCFTMYNVYYDFFECRIASAPKRTEPQTDNHMYHICRFSSFVLYIPL